MASDEFRKELRRELIGAIGRRAAANRRVARWQRPQFLYAVAGAAIVIALGGIATLQAIERPNTSSGQQKDVTGGLSDAPPAHAGGTRMTLADARAQLPFSVVVPADPSANEKNLTDVYLYAAGILEMDFPAVAKSSVRQPYISVVESQWSGGDPAAFFAEDAQGDPDIGKTVCNVGALPALCVAANSPSDATQSNPAYLRFVVNGIDVEVSGGDDLHRLQGIATSIANRSQNSEDQTPAP